VNQSSAMPVMPNQVEIPMISRNSNAMYIRRLYALSDMEIPDRYQADLPVRVSWTSLRTPKSEWLLESLQIRPELHVARTLLSDEGTGMAVHLVNVSGVKQTIRGGTCLGTCSTSCRVEPACKLRHVLDWLRPTLTRCWYAPARP
jgi:hypothetical protein